MPNYNRQLYNVNALFVSPTATGFHYESGASGATLVEQLHRIISFSDSFNIPLQGATQVGQLAEFTRQPIGSPTPSLTFDYYLHNGVNEERLGFNINGQSSFISGILNKTEDEKNFFISMVPEGSDAIGYTDRTQMKTIGIGNGYLTDWTLNASVGDFATCSVSIEGLNYDIKTGSSSIALPSVNPENGIPITDKYFTLPIGTTGVAGMPKIIKRGDISFDFSSMANKMGTKLHGDGAAKIQSISFSCPFSRSPLEKLDSKYAFSRELDFPITATMSIEALTSDVTTGSLADLLGCGLTEYDFEIVFSACEGNVTTPVFRLIASGATLDQESFSQSAGSQGRTSSMNFSIPIGSAESAYPVVKISGSAYA